MNKRLAKIESALKDYFCYYKSDDILVVSEDKSTLPFAFFIQEISVPNTVVMALAVDYSDCFAVSQVSILAATATSVVLGEVFYISPKNGETHFGEEALNQFDLENFDITDVVPISEHRH